MMRIPVFIILLLIICLPICAKNIHVGAKYSHQKIKKALSEAHDEDTIVIHEGTYKEGNIIIQKKITLLGINKPVLDGQNKYEILSIKSSGVIVQGLIIQNSGFSTLDDPGAIKIYNCDNVIIKNNELRDNFFGIYLQQANHCKIEHNRIHAKGVEEQQIGNGIHCWKSDSIIIVGNKINGHRDGIYFEFVTNSVIWRNISFANIRYGLHFMFSNDDAYISNVFKNNGAGVSVMFTHRVKMFNNYFLNNWGDAAYGLLLKEISDSYILHNRFNNNTSGIYMEGTNRILVEHNTLKENGWGMKIQANCMDNIIRENNFLGNTFDISTNGTLVLNTFNENYWDKYEGYDLDKDKFGDVPYRPLSLFSVMVESNSSLMLLFRSFMVSLLDKSEKIIPSLTPENFIDNKPRMHSVVI